MIKLAKYLKPFIFFIIISIILLFAQAMADLTLPDYMSNIVNNGIQQGGITNAVPKALRQSEMDKLTIFMGAEDKVSLIDDYILIDKTSPDYSKYLEDYPVLEKEPVYLLKKISAGETNRINPIFGKAFLVVSGIEQMMKDPAKAAAESSKLGFDKMGL